MSVAAPVALSPVEPGISATARIFRISQRLRPVEGFAVQERRVGSSNLHGSGAQGGLPLTPGIPVPARPR